MSESNVEKVGPAELSCDVRRGHAYVKAHNGRIVAQLADLGGACAVMTEGDMTPDEARLLGHALISWSAWRRNITPTIDHYQRTGGAA